MADLTEAIRLQPKKEALPRETASPLVKRYASRQNRAQTQSGDRT